eukprot:3893080-Prymnesium_polylepis.1
MGLKEWLFFVSTEQLALRGNPSEIQDDDESSRPSTVMHPSDGEAQSAELCDARERFENVLSTGVLHTNPTLSPMQFALQLLDSHNN